jgi:apolipoprotein D and lipocalin family protein
VVDRQSNSKLRVNFLPAFFRWLGIGWGNYWVIDLDQNYQYSVVSEPTKEYLWILARQAKLPQDVLNRILGNLKALGFDLSKLKIN